MPWLIRNSAGEVCGICTNRPGQNNKLQDGSIESHEYVEGDTAEMVAFRKKIEDALKGQS